MFIAINRLFVKPGCGSDVEQRFGQAHGLEGQPGFLGFHLLRQVWRASGSPEHEEYLVVTEWTSQQDFQDWIRSDVFKRAHTNVRRDLFVAPAEASGYTIAVEYESNAITQ